MVKAKKGVSIDSSNFWDTDLKDIEESFLPEGVAITDLSTTLDARVPPGENSELLDRVVNMDEVITGCEQREGERKRKKKGFFRRMFNL